MDLSKLLDSIEKVAAQTIQIEEGDYVLDGLLYCHKCNTPKQCRITVLDRVRTPYCLCKCGKERRDAEEAEQKHQEQLAGIRELRKMGFPDAEMQGWTFDNDDQANGKVSGVARNYVEHFEQMRKNGKGLLLYGPVGTGKTFISACIANALIDKGYPCMATNFARLTNIIQGMREGRQEYIDSLDRFALLVIDDIASERDTEYMQEIVTNIIDARYRSRKPLIVTTNLTSEELKNPAEMRKQRIYSRLFEMCVPVEVAGKDRRKAKLKDDYGEMERLLGL